MENNTTQSPAQLASEGANSATSAGETGTMEIAPPAAHSPDLETPFKIFNFFPEEHLPQALSIYGAIRSFSFMLRVSPIHPLAFSRALLATHSTGIMDIIHMRMQR